MDITVLPHATLEHLESWLPPRRHAGFAPARHLSAKLAIVHLENRRAMIGLLAVAFARAHAATNAATFVKHLHEMAGILQRRGAR